MGCLGKRLVITSHGRQRVEEREITLTEVESALRNCLRHEAGDHGNVVHVGVAGRRTLRVVTAPADLGERTILVITAMWS
jgi:hypothetical protein